MKRPKFLKIAETVPVYIATVLQLQMELVFITILLFTVLSINVNVFYKHLLHKYCFGSCNSTDICLSSHQAHKKVISSSWQLKCQTQSIQSLGALPNCMYFLT